MLVTYSLVVDNLDNSGKLALESTAILDKDNTANLDLSPVGSLDRCVSHFFDCVNILVSDRTG